MRKGCSVSERRLQVVPIGVVRLFPARHLGLPRFHQRPGLAGHLHPPVSRPWRRARASWAFVSSCCAWRTALANGERIALHDLMHDMEEIRHTQALQPLFGELDQGLGPVTDQVQHLRCPGALSRSSTNAFHVA